VLLNKKNVSKAYLVNLVAMGTHPARGDSPETTNARDSVFLKVLLLGIYYNDNINSRVISQQYTLNVYKNIL